MILGTYENLNFNYVFSDFTSKGVANSSRASTIKCYQSEKICSPWKKNLQLQWYTIHLSVPQLSSSFCKMPLHGLWINIGED